MSTRELLHKKVVRYLIAGGAAFFSEYLIFLILFYSVMASVISANIISFTIGFAVSFTLNKFWVFQTGSANILRQLTTYLIVALVNIVITSTAIKYLVDMGVSGYIAKIVLIVCVAAWNFMLFKCVIFRAVR